MLIGFSITEPLIAAALIWATASALFIFDRPLFQGIAFWSLRIGGTIVLLIVGAIVLAWAARTWRLARVSPAVRKRFYAFQQARDARLIAEEEEAWEQIFAETFEERSVATPTPSST